jgi:hypothetical protein
MKLMEHREKPKSGLPEDGLFILVGQPKSGKTTFAASFPDSYILELEPKGADRVSGRIHEISSLSEFREALKATIEEPSIKTIVIDTVDQLSDWIEDDVAHEHGLENISERKSGVDGFEVWGQYRDKIESLIGYLKASNKLIILNAHCREAKSDPNGMIVTPMGINMPGKAGAYLAAQAEIIGYSYKKQVGTQTNYYISFQGGPLGAWGSRVDELNDRILTIPRNEPYSAFQACFLPNEQLVAKKKSKGDK